MTELKPSEIKPIIKFIIQNNVDLAAKTGNSIALNLIGVAGISKTSCVKQVVHESFKDSHYFVKPPISQAEVGDIIGYPVVEVEVCSKEDNSCKWICRDILNDFLLQGYSATGQHRMGYSLPLWLVGKQDKPIILLLDDYTRASPMVLQALMQVFEEQETISWKLPLGSTVIGTSNPDNGEYLVSSTDDASSTRALDYYMKASVEDWAFWAVNNVEEKFINFLEKNKELIEGTGASEKGKKVKLANLRIWTKYFQTIAPITNFNDDDNWGMALNLGSGSLPVEHLILFKNFCDQGFDVIPTAKEILFDKEYDKLEKLVKICDNRQDISTFISRRLLNYVLQMNVKTDFTPDIVNRLEQIIAHGQIITPDLTFIFVKKIAGIAPLRPLLKNPVIIKALAT